MRWPCAGSGRAVLKDVDVQAPDYQRAQCPECLGLYCITRHGKLRAHSRVTLEEQRQNLAPAQYIDAPGNEFY